MKNDLKKSLQHLQPSSYMDYRHYIRDLFTQMKSLKKISWVDFNESCGLGKNNTLYQIVHADRPLSAKMATKLGDALGLSAGERKYFLQLQMYQSAKNSGTRAEALEKLLDLKSRCLSADWDRDQLQLFSEWYHLTILEMLRLDHAQDNPQWIAQHLQPRVAVSKVKKSLELLEDMQWIAYDEEKKRLYPTRHRVSTGREIRGIAIQNYHQTMIQLASQALSQEKPARRDITSVTVSVPKDAMKDLKDLTAEFRQKILELADRCDHSDDIVQVNIQLFPLTQTGGSGDGEES